MLFEDDDVVRMIEEWWGRLETKFENVTTDEFVVMPNHVHGIVFIDHPKAGTTHGSSPTQTETAVGADPRVRPDNTGRFEPGPTHGSTPTNDGELGEHDVGADPRVRPHEAGQSKSRPTHGPAPTQDVSLGRIVQWFKTMTTNAYIRRAKTDGWTQFPGRLWQRNYYDHIIRDEDDLHSARRYICNNPTRWAEDRYYKTREC